MESVSGCDFDAQGRLVELSRVCNAGGSESSPPYGHGREGNVVAAFGLFLFFIIIIFGISAMFGCLESGGK